MVEKKTNYRKLTMDTFKGKDTDGIVWQPRIYYWYYGSGLKNSTPEGYHDESVLQWMRRNVDSIDNAHIPKKYEGKTMLEIYKDLGASPRYPLEVLGVPIFKGGILDYWNETSTGFANDKRVKVRSSFDKETGETITIYKTPKGNLCKVEAGYVKEYPIKDPQDIDTMKYIIKKANFEFDQDAFEIARNEFGEQGPVTGFVLSSPLQSLILNYMGFEETIIGLHKYEKKIKSLLKTIDKWHDKVYDVVLNSPVKIINFGENIDQHFNSPPIFEKYLLPYYEKRIKQIHANDKYCTLHVDGHFRQLIPLLKKTSFDGLEALTPKPQGDVTLEEMKEAVGDKVLLDGIPATFFTDSYSYKELEEFTKRVLDLFAPNLILGVSDEVPPTAEINRVKFVSRIVDDYSPQM